jgi:hypothetical protein
LNCHAKKRRRKKYGKNFFEKSMHPFNNKNASGALGLVEFPPVKISHKKQKNKEKSLLKDATLRSGS